MGVFCYVTLFYLMPLSLYQATIFCASDKLVIFQKAFFSMVNISHILLLIFKLQNISKSEGKQQERSELLCYFRF